jgi:plasmid replication initiation protein
MEIIKTKKIRQSNHLIESPYSQEFTTHEIKLFEIAAAGVTLEDMKSASLRVNKRFSLSSNQIAILLNTSVSVISHEIEKTCARIIKKAIHLRKILDDGNVEFEMINIVPYAKYKNGVLDYDLNYAIIPYLLEINKNFTEFQLSYLLLMRSSYAIKLYKLLYQYKSIKSRVFTIDNLKEQFGIIDKYPQYKNLKQKIIDLSVLQINEFTDLNVKYNEIKSGRKVDKLEFIFELKKTQSSTTKQVDVINENDEILNTYSPIESELSNQTKELIIQYTRDKGLDYVEASIDYAKKKC